MPATRNNRVADHIVQMRAQIAGITPAARETLNRDMDVTAREHFAYQEAQARAHVSGKLSTNEAQVVYMALGENGSGANGGWAAETDLATKVTVTLLMGELLKR
jgi:hypothetical protein